MKVKVSNSIKKRFENKPVYTEKDLKANTEFYKGKKPIQIFMIIKDQKKVLIVFVYY